MKDAGRKWRREEQRSQRQETSDPLRSWGEDGKHNVNSIAARDCKCVGGGTINKQHSADSQPVESEQNSVGAGKQERSTAQLHLSETWCCHLSQIVLGSTGG